MKIAARTLAVRWALPVGIVLALVLITWLVGGFRPAAATAGPTADFEQTLQLRRWTVQLHPGLVLTDTTADGVETDPAFRVRATVELTADTSDSFPDLIQVRVPGGPATDYRRVADSLSESFDPDLPREQVWDFPWAGTHPPSEVTIVVLDEEPSRGYLFADDWTVGDPAGVITAPVTDERTRT